MKFVIVILIGMLSLNASFAQANKTQFKKQRHLGGFNHIVVKKNKSEKPKDKSSEKNNTIATKKCDFKKKAGCGGKDGKLKSKPTTFMAHKKIPMQKNKSGKKIKIPKKMQERIKEELETLSLE
jgi:hypothetical protein